MGEHRRPNMLVLMSDQHKRSCMGVAGDRVSHTPNLDALARESIRFTNTYCTNPVCGPSRASIMTGLYTFNLEVLKSAKSFAFAPKHKTIAHQFGASGYLTALIGKMHFADAQTHGFDYKLDFNDWWQYLGPKVKLYVDETGHPNASGAGLPQIDTLWNEEGDPWKGHRTPDGRLGAVAVGRPSLMDEADHFDSFVARESVRFLEDYAHTEEPFLLVTSFLKPHDPFMPAKRFAEMYRAEDMQLSPTWKGADLTHLPAEVRRFIETAPFTPELLEAPHARERMACYYASLAQMDDCVGQVLSALKRLGLDRNTIVLYTSDHGEMLGDLGLWNKFQFYEGSCGVPLLIRLPEASPALCEQPVSLISLKQTLAELCSVPDLGPSDGASFASLVRNPASARHDAPVFAEFNAGKPRAKYMIRRGDYKYTHWVHDIDELYNLREDPGETRNIAAAHRITVEHLRSDLLAWHQEPTSLTSN